MLSSGTDPCPRKVETVSDPEKDVESRRDLHVEFARVREASLW